MGALAGMVDKGLMAPDWAEAMAPVEDRIARMGQFLREELASGRGYLPAGDHVFRAFQRPLADVRVLVVGQDPYPTPGHPIGLSFAVDPGVWPLPRSLINIYVELRDDTGIVPPRSGDLTPWSDQGVMLLNRVLTVRPGRVRLAPRAGLGGDHRARDLGAGTPGRGRRSLRRDPVGPRRAEPQARARPDPVGRVGASVTAVGEPRLLRLAPVLASQPAAGRAGGRAGRLVAGSRVRSADPDSGPDS